MPRPVIIGGGLAGGAAATRLAQLGQQPLLLEREAGAHDKICGEFLSVEAGHHLAAIGLDVARLGGARIDTMRLHAGRRSAATRLPFVATGITRRLLDAALLDHAAAAGATIERGTMVRHIADGRAVTAAGEVTAGPLLIATGKHELRGAGRDPRGTMAGLIGFKQFFKGSAAMAVRLGGAVEVTAYDGGYAGVQIVENQRINLCLLIDRQRYQQLGGSWPALFAALVREPGLAFLSEAETLLARPLTIASVPYGFLARADAANASYRLGDQAAVIPSFCGDGMAMALHSGRLAAEMIAAGADGPVFQARLRADVAGQVRLATRLQRFASTPLGRFAMVAGLGAVPPALAALARWTRVRPDALARLGVA